MRSLSEGVHEGPHAVPVDLQHGGHADDSGDDDLNDDAAEAGVEILHPLGGVGGMFAHRNGAGDSRRYDSNGGQPVTQERGRPGLAQVTTLLFGRQCAFVPRSASQGARKIVA